MEWQIWRSLIVMPIQWKGKLNWCNKVGKIYESILNRRGRGTANAIRGSHVVVVLRNK
jgi:hypothetical protein